MNKRILGGGLEVSALGFGCMGLNLGLGSGVGRSTAVSLIRGAFERGVTLFDTAEAYGPFTNEELSPHDLAEIEDAAAEITIQGARCPEHLQRRVGR